MNPLARLRLVVRDVLFLALLLFAVAFFGAGIFGIPYLVVTRVGWPNTAEEWIGVVALVPVWLAFVWPLGLVSRWREGLEGLKRWWSGA
jgi:hypothetical protein